VAPSPVQQGTQQAELGALLAGAVQAVIQAQHVLDEDARERTAAFSAAPPGTLALPPLWFAIDTVSLDVELSSQVVQSQTPSGVDTTFLCRTVNPVTVGLFGYTASTGMRVSLTLAPQRMSVAPPPAPSA